MSLSMSLDLAAPTPRDLTPAYQGARALVTGGLGLIGSALARCLVELGAVVTIVDALVTESSANLHNIAPIRERVQLELVDVRTTHTLETLLAGQDYIFNLAGQSSHMASMADPLADLDVNCRAQLALLDACRRVNPQAVIVFASTRQIYGRPEYFPVDERHPLSPIDVNGVDKMAGEAFHLLYHDAFGLRTSALRLTNTYGPGMRIKDARQTFVGIWLRSLIEGLPFEVWGGNQKRDFTYVDDVVNAFLLIAACPQARGHAFNLGGDRVITLRELAELLIAANGGGEFVVRSFPEERKHIDIGDYYADDALLRRTTSWRPQVTLEQGVDRTLGYFRDHFHHYV
jgi:UDP-glucose 4-epimerase